jgi:hypothetical protein
MSSLLTLKQIRGMEVEDVIPAVSGTLTAVSAAKSGGTGKKAWTVQNVEISQGNDKMRVCVWNRDELIPMNWKGKKVTVLSTEQQEGITGVSCADNENQNKVTREIKVQANKGGEITLGGSGAAGENEDGAGQETAEPPKPATATAKPIQTSQPAKPAVNPFAAGVFGGTVGMALKETSTAITGMGVPMFINESTLNPKWLKMLWIGASGIIRVSRSLEDGKLAPKPAVESVAPACPVNHEVSAPAKGTPSSEQNPPVAAPIAGDEPVEGDECPM